MRFLSTPSLALYGTLLSALVFGGWRLDVSRQEVGYKKAVAKYTEMALTASKAARDREQQMQATATKATHEAKVRETKLARDAGVARSESDRLRNNLATVRSSIPGLTRDAVDRYADAASIVFAECVREYSEMAATAGALASDRQTLMDAWPKNDTSEP